MVRLSISLFIGSLFVLASCGGSSSSQTTTTAVDPFVPSAVRWSTCPENDDLKCADLKVPYDYGSPNLGSFTLKLTMREAESRSERIGFMLTNPGGPGFGGSYLAEGAYSYFSEELIERFDIVGFDPRGTGESTPAVDCVDEYDPYFSYDPSPDTDEEKQDIINASKNFAEECRKKNEKILPYISTNNTARDINAIRRALGADTISYFGFSYGSELGATWATMFPDTVRAAVLDGAADPASDYVQGGLDQAKGFEKELTKFLESCSSRPSCAFHNDGKAEKAFDALMLQLDEKPLVVSPSRTSVNQGVALMAVAQAMYTSTLWDSLEAALSAAQQGRGRPLLEMYDSYYQRQGDGSYGNELEAFFAISCVDDQGPISVEESDSFLPKFIEVAPRLGSSFASGYICTFWPDVVDQRITITGEGAGPIVVIGTTGDAATPLQSSRNMASALQDGRFIVVTANQHTGYGANQCVLDAVDDYLITGQVSWEEKQC